MSRGFSVQIHLVNGSPEGLWHVKRSNWVGLGLSASRAQFKDIKKRPEFQNAGIYILVGKDDEGDKFFVGEAETLGTRLGNHVQDTNKDFWHRLVAFTAADNSLNKAHGRYLEDRLISLGKEAGADLANATSSPNSRLVASEVDDLEEFLDNILLLLPIMGIAAFERPEIDETATVYNFTGRGSDAKAQYLPEGFLVMQGSKGAATESKSFQGSSEQRLRKRLLDDGILVESDGALLVTRDHVFTSPSAATGVLGGTGYNGWREWKDVHGRTLDENERAAVDAGE